jgi:aryl-alcohol dehydrogenase-like predicted oxidoreductase
VLYLGISDTPAWIVVKANECTVPQYYYAHETLLMIHLVARRNGLTPFSVYQGRWNAAFRDMESEIIPMCEDQGMGIVSWASLGGGQLTTAEQRRKMEQDPDAPKGYGHNEFDIPVSNVIGKIADTKKASFQQVVSRTPRILLLFQF